MDLSGSTGNMAVVGGPQSGKSTAIRTLITSLAATHSAEQVQFYCLDFGGGTLAGLSGLPHVGSVANRLDVDRVRRTIAEMNTIVRQREERFRELGVESMAEFRRLRATDPGSGGAAAGVAQDPFGDVFLVIDGFGSVRQDFEALEQQITNLRPRGCRTVCTSCSPPHGGARSGRRSRISSALGSSCASVIPRIPTSVGRPRHSFPKADPDAA